MKVYLKGTFNLCSDGTIIKVRKESPCKEFSVGDILVKVIPEDENTASIKEVVDEIRRREIE